MGALTAAAALTVEAAGCIVTHPPGSIACAAPWPSLQGWTSCKGSKSDSRGYSCGLWYLLHALAARMPEAGNSGAVWLAGVKGFIKHYFQCR